MKRTFIESLKSAEVLVADGATGTNLQARGLTKGTPSEVWLLEQPGEIVKLHRDFIHAGSNIILTNTFGCTSVHLESIGMSDRADELNRMAVILAKQAVGDQPVFIAGSIGPTGQLLKPMGTLEEPTALHTFADQARALNEAGVDLLVVETQFDLGEALAAVKGVRSVSQLPLVVSFSYDRGMRTMMGVRPTQMAAEFEGLDVNVLGINCGRSLEDNLKNLKELRGATKLPIWFKPNAGLPRLDEAGNTIFDVSPEQMGAHAAEWVTSGAKVVGGCCGTSPDHLKQIARAVRKSAG